MKQSGKNHWENMAYALSFLQQIEISKKKKYH